MRIPGGEGGSKFKIFQDRGKIIRLMGHKNIIVQVGIWKTFCIGSDFSRDSLKVDNLDQKHENIFQWFCVSWEKFNKDQMME